MENSGADRPPEHPANDASNSLPKSSPNSPPESSFDGPPNYGSTNSSPKYQPRKSVDLLDKKDLSPATLLEVDNSNFLTIELNQNDYQPVRAASRPVESFSKSLPQHLTEPSPQHFPPPPPVKLSHSNSLTSSATTTATKNIYYICAHCSYRYAERERERVLSKLLDQPN